MSLNNASIFSTNTVSFVQCLQKISKKISLKKEKSY